MIVVVAVVISTGNFIYGFSMIAALFILMLRTSSSIDSSTSTTRTTVEYDEVDGGRSGAGDKSVEKLSKVEELSKSSKNLKGLKKFAKAIGLEERLPRHRSSVNWIRRTRASVTAL